MPKLIANEKFYYAGRNVEANAEFEAEQGDVPLLTNAISPKARQAPPSADATVPVVTPAPVGQMQSRSLLPEGDGEQAATPIKRRYTRRDMQVED